MCSTRAVFLARMVQPELPDWGAGEVLGGSLDLAYGTEELVLGAYRGQVGSVGAG